MERPAPATSSLSDLFATLPTGPAVESEPLFPSQELIAGGDYLLHDQQFLQEQEALQLLNQTNLSLSSSSSALPVSPLPSVKAANVKQTQKSKASRKRSRSATEEASAEESGRKMTAVSLPREKLLHMTSKEYDVYMKDVSRRRGNLTQDEIKDLRWMKRLVKNRESAQISRDRKKNRLDELTGIWNELKAEQKGLNDQLTALEISNKALKEELNNLVGIVRQSPALASLWNNMHLLRKRTTAKIPDDKSLFNNQAAAAMCLMFAMHTYNQALTARAAEAVAEPEPALPVARTKCMEASDELRSEMQYVAEQLPNGEQPVLLMLLPQSAAASVLRNQAVAQQALVLDLAGAQLVPAVPVQS